MLFQKTLVLCLLASTACGMPLTAFAADDAKLTSDKDKSEDAGAITVTAQRRAQNIQDVPIAVSALSSDTLAKNQITNTLQVARLVPNFVANTNIGIGSANNYSIRGIGSGETAATFDPAVGTYVDDVYMSRQNANNFAFFDIDRIEVLRGPQGTLFGRNTTGGAINVVLKKPGTVFAGFAEGSYGSYNQAMLRASLDLPVDDKVLTKISAYGMRRDGYVHNLTNGERDNGRNEWGVRGAVRLLPSDTVTWDLSASFGYSNDLNLPDTVVDGKRISLTGLSKNSAGLAGLVTGPKGNYHLQNVVGDLGLTSNLNIETDAFNVSVISGFRRLVNDYMLDLYNGPAKTGGYSLAFQGEFNQYTQEIKVNGKGLQDRLNWTVGAFYIYESDKSDYADVYTLGDATTGFIPLVLGDRVLRNSTSAPALYGQFDYKIVPALTLTVGGRYTIETKQFTFETNDNPLVALPFGTSQILSFGIPPSLTTKRFTPRVALDYKVDRDLSFYASATEGFRSGGWNARATRPELFLSFGPETAWSYEGGLRSQWFDRHVTFNLTGFYQRLEKYQLPSAVMDSRGIQNYVVQNAADIHIYGAELDMSVRPFAGMTVFLNGGVLSAKYVNASSQVLLQQSECLGGDQSACGTGMINPDGGYARPQNTPKLNFTIGGNYEFAIGAYKLIPSANAHYTSSRNIDSAATVLGSVGSELLMNAGIGFGPENDRWTINAECTNCTNRSYASAIIGPDLFHIEPSIWSIRARYNF